MQLLQVLKKKPYCNDTHLILIPIIILLISIKYWWFIIFLLLYLIYIIKKTKLIVPILIIIIMIVVGRIAYQYILEQNYKGGDITGQVVEVIDENTYILSTKGIKIRVYDYNQSYKPGDIINADISINEIDKKSYEADFDYEEYLKSNGISYQGSAKTSTLIKHSFSLASIKYYYQSYLKKYLSDESYSYVSAMVFGDNLLSDDIKDSYSVLGISHVLAISGMHIIMIYNILSFILLKLFKYYRSNIQLVIIVLFVILINAPSSCVRSLLFLVIGHLNKNGNNKYTKLDILSISCLIMLIYNPYQIFSVGFILSFLVCFILAFSNELINNKNKLLHSYKLFYLIFFITLPFVININNSVSIGSLLLSPILSLAVTYIILPLSYLLAVFPILDVFIKYIFIFINTYILNISKVFPILHLQSFNIFLCLIYYVFFIVLLITLAQKRRVLISISTLISFVVIINMLRLINPITTVTFVDVGQGDSTVIELGNNKGVIVIDAYNSLDYLKSKGIYNISYLVLTHSDEDHIGDYKEILDYFNVKHILYPSYDSNFGLLLRDYNNAHPITNISNISLEGINIKILGPMKAYEGTNDNSIVLRIDINNIKFLFCGDISTEQELDLINYYGNELNSDVLKVAHHGSSTSSSQAFIDIVSPNYSIISVGKNNKYGHPNIEVYNRLRKVSVVYQTMDTGNITFNLMNSKIWVSTYR